MGAGITALNIILNILLKDYILLVPTTLGSSLEALVLKGDTLPISPKQEDQGITSCSCWLGT